MTPPQGREIGHYEYPRYVPCLQPTQTELWGFTRHLCSINLDLVLYLAAAAQQLARGVRR